MKSTSQLFTSAIRSPPNFAKSPEIYVNKSVHQLVSLRFLKISPQVKSVPAIQFPTAKPMFAAASTIATDTDICHEAPSDLAPSPVIKGDTMELTLVPDESKNSETPSAARTNPTFAETLDNFDDNNVPTFPSIPVNFARAKPATIVALKGSSLNQFQSPVIMPSANPLISS